MQNLVRNALIGWELILALLTYSQMVASQGEGALLFFHMWKNRSHYRNGPLVTIEMVGDFHIFVPIN